MDTFDLLIGPILILLGVLAFYFLVFRPLLRMLKAKQPGKDGPSGILDSLPDDAADLDLPRLKLTDQDRIRRLAKSNPDKAKELVQLWLQQGRGGKR